MTTVQTIDEQIAALAKQKADLVAADKARIEAEEKKKREAAEQTARKKEYDANNKIFLAIAAAATKIPEVTASVEYNGESQPKLTILGENAFRFFDVTHERTRGHGRFGWGSTPTGKLRITVGEHGSRQSYPQRKDGSHNYEEIAWAIVSSIRINNKRNNDNGRRLANEAAVGLLQKELGIDRWSVLSASTSADKPIAFSLQIKRELTLDETRNLVAALRAAGVM